MLSDHGKESPPMLERTTNWGLGRLTRAGMASPSNLLLFPIFCHLKATQATSSKWCHVEHVIQLHNPSPGFLAKQLAPSSFFLPVACDDHGQVRNPTKTNSRCCSSISASQRRRITHLLIRHHEGLSVVVGVGLGNQKATTKLSMKS